MSRLPFELLLALRYLRPRRSFVSIITLISVMGVMLGVAVLIIVICVMNGFDKDMRARVLGFNAHLKITEPQASISDYALLINKIKSVPEVTGAAPFVLGQVMIETQPSTGQSLVSAPYMRGVDPTLEHSVSDLPSSIIAGKFDLSGRSVVVGSDLAQGLNITVGDHISIYSPNELKKMKEKHAKGEDTAILPDDYTVSGIFDVGFYEYDATFIVTSLENAQDLYELNDTVHGINVTVRDPFQVESVAQKLGTKLGPDYELTTWMEESPLLMAVMVEKNLMLYILFFIVIVAAFGITCTLITFIVMKTREVGLLKALGATDRQVMSVFLGQSLIVSVLGVAAGLALGLVAVAYRNEFLHFMRHVTHQDLLPASVYGLDQLPALVVPSDLVIICGGSLLICLLAAAFPARFASRMNLVEALRYE